MTFTLWANKTGSKCPSLCPFCFEYGRLGFTVLHGLKKKKISVFQNSGSLCLTRIYVDTALLNMDSNQPKAQESYCKASSTLRPGSELLRTYC